VGWTAVVDNSIQITLELIHFTRSEVPPRHDHLIAIYKYPFRSELGSVFSQSMHIQGSIFIRAHNEAFSSFPSLRSPLPLLKPVSHFLS